MEIALIVSALMNILGGITLLITLQKLKENEPPF
jgi:hypothetical protein